MFALDFRIECREMKIAIVSDTEADRDNPSGMDSGTWHHCWVMVSVPLISLLFAIFNLRPIPFAIT